MRKEAVNTFTEGMVRDLNPINTPSNVLTDCLNGTLVTYDDNELSLQNDKGNYPLIHCKLKPGYVPVGTKEYNGIIYIVSHNPVENTTEIGSYPSPGQLKLGGDKGSNISINIDWQARSYEDFCTRNSKLYNFIFDGGEDTWLINPGDQIQIQNQDLSSIKPVYYQYYLINKEHNSTDVTDEVVKHPNTEDFWYVPWKGSGWLAVKPTLPNISDFRINIRKFKLIPYTNTLEYSFNVEMEFDNIDFGDNRTLSNYLGLDIEFPNAVTDTVVNTVEDSNPNGRTIKVWNYSGKINNVTTVQQFVFKPFITVPVGAASYKYYYDSYKKTIIADPNNTASIKDVEIANRVFRYRVDSRATSQNNGQITFEFSSGNIDEAALYEEDIELYYVISKFTSNNTWTPVGGIQKYSNFNLYGTNLLAIETSPFTSINESLSSTLFAEDIYRIQFIVTPTLEDTSSINAANTSAGITENSNSTYSVFTIYSVVTELMNGYSADRYDQVPVSAWINKYPDTINETVAKLNFDDSGSSPEISVSPDPIYTKWITGSTLKGGQNSYNRAFTSEDYEEYFKDGFNINISAVVRGALSLDNDLSILAGPIWKDLIQYIDIKVGDKETKFDSYTGKINQVPFTSEDMIYEAPLHCDLKRLSAKLPFVNYSYKDLIPYGKDAAAFYISPNSVPDKRTPITAVVTPANNNGPASYVGGIYKFTNFTNSLDKIYDSTTIDKPLLFVTLSARGLTKSSRVTDYWHFLVFEDFLTEGGTARVPPEISNPLIDVTNNQQATRYFVAKKVGDNYIYFDLGNGERDAWNSYNDLVSNLLKAIEVEDDEVRECLFIESNALQIPTAIKLTDSIERYIEFDEIISIADYISIPSDTTINLGQLPSNFSNKTLTSLSLSNPISVNIEHISDLEDIQDKIADVNSIAAEQYEKYQNDVNYKSIMQNGASSINGKLTFVHYDDDPSWEPSHFESIPGFLDALNGTAVFNLRDLCIGYYIWVRSSHEIDTKGWHRGKGQIGYKITENAQQ